jgi:hypothetical protein
MSTSSDEVSGSCSVPCCVQVPVASVRMSSSFNHGNDFEIDEIIRCKDG